MKHIFLVTSPLQLLSAIEAKKEFGGEENILIIKYFSNPINNRQMKGLLDMTTWSKIIYLKHYRFKSTFLNDFYQFTKIKKEIVNCDKLFIGDYTPINVRVFAANILANEIFLLDDGMITVYVQKNYLHSNIPYVHNNIEDTLKRWIAKWVFGLDSNIQKTINLFSCFSLTPYPGQKAVKNNFLFLKNIINQQQQSAKQNTVFFMGGPLLEKKCIDETLFINIMGKIISYYKNSEFIYIPHRDETDANVEMLRNKLNFQVMKFEDIAETGFVKKKIIPTHLASFYSTTLITMSHIYPDCKINSFLLPLSEVNLKYRQGVKDCYEYLKEHVNVIDLKS